ncbi:MAG: efflux RND transporter permease subunit [Cyanobacteria bacterium HKST-UBA03]|nr:efflux RND transporter permease subunit [Cyanobacteria bacterium HKST-UBA03]
MDSFLAQFIKQRLLILIGCLLVIIGGVYSFQSIPIDAFPDLTNNQVQVITEVPGYAPIETEQLVTIPIESIMNGLPKVDLVRSISKFGLSVVTVVFKDDVDIYFARQLVNERLQSARSRLPSGIDPELGPITTGMGEIYQYVVDGPGYTPTELKTLHDWDIKYQLRTIAGVNEVNTWGGFTLEYQVVVSPESLLRYNLSFQDVFMALQNNNANFSGGIIEHQSEQYIVRGLGRVNSLDDIGNILVKADEVHPVFIKTIADVRYGHELRQGAVTKDGQGEVVTGMIMMLKGENSRAVIERVKTKLTQIRDSLPAGVSIKPFYDQTHLIEQTIETVRTNLIEGGMLVIAVLLFMLGNIRAALIVALVIPLSLMFSFMGMRSLGIAANVMSLGAIDFGMIVDGAIVMVEDILRKLSENTDVKLSHFDIIQQSVREMAKPIFFGVLIITVVYAPILSLEGMEYKLFSPMVFTVSFALLGSLLITLFLVPVLCSFFLRGPIKEKPNCLIEIIRPAYLNTLEKALHYRSRTLLVAIVLFALTCASVPFLGSEFVPELDEGDFQLEVRNLPSISLPEATNITTHIERVCLEVQEVQTVVSKIGRADVVTDPMGVYQADVYVKLKPRGAWDSGVSKETIEQRLSQKLNDKVPGVNFSFTQPIAMRVDELVSGVKSDVAVKLFGEDLTVLMEKAHQIEALLKDVDGVADLQTEQLEGTGQLLIEPDRHNMALYGVNISDIQTLVETAVIGHPVSEVIEGKKRFTLRVNFPTGSQTQPEAIESLLLHTSTNAIVPLGQVAKITLGAGWEKINREFAQRRIIIQMNVRNRDIGSFVAEGKAQIAQHVTLPPGYYTQWGGQFENQQRATNKLLLVVPLSVLIIFFLLMGTFQNVKHALLVMLNVPFALIGGVMALWLRSMYLSVPASIGFIALFGVAVLNGLVLISTINRLRGEGQTVHQAILEGAKTRLRPVLMTAMVAILGFLPMALSTGSGAEVQKPLATVVIGGLFTSTLLTLIVLPVIYSWLSPEREQAAG